MWFSLQIKTRFNDLVSGSFGEQGEITEWYILTESFYIFMNEGGERDMWLQLNALILCNFHPIYLICRKFFGDTATAMTFAAVKLP